jgi:23S rRNA maturation mini-RNase III
MCTDCEDGVSEPRNVDDVPYVESTDLETRPMREVLRDRAARSAKIPKAQREQAFRIRAGMQAVLGSCLCLVPLELYETESTHASWCPGNAIWLSQREAEKRYG